MGLCLRGKMAEVGLVPATPEPAVAEVEDASSETAAVVEETVSEEPALDLTPPADAMLPASTPEAEPADVDGVVSATFGLLRAEPDGSVVIAGSGTPGSKVIVYANGEQLGTVEVEASGDWVFVPDTPLPVGGLEITLGEEGKDGTAADSFIVVINEDKTSQPLVVASKPGEASEVLQGLTAPTQVAAAPETPSAEPPAATPAAPEPTPPVTEPAAPATEPSVETAAAPAPEPDTAPEATDASPAPEAGAPTTTAMAPSATPEAPAQAPDEAATASEPAPVAEPAAPATEPATPATEPPATAAAPTIVPVPAEPSTAVAGTVPPSIDAIEIETNRTFFAGAGPEGGVIRLYVDDAFIADATIEGGRWLVEAGPVLDKPSQRVRVDLLEPGAADVVARAEVDFVVDVPEVEPSISVAQAPESAAPAEPAPAATPEANTEVAAATEPAAATPDVAPAAEPATPEPAVAADATPPAEPAATEPVTAEPASEPVAPAEPAVPTMVAVSLGDPEAQRFVSGKAIIRRGDNLWTIARRVYGEGLKFTTIYEANTGQIRDPDRIYPGQVFALPEDAPGQ